MLGSSPPIKIQPQTTVFLKASVQGDVEDGPITPTNQMQDSPLEFALPRTGSLFQESARPVIGTSTRQDVNGTEETTGLSVSSFTSKWQSLISYVG